MRDRNAMERLAAILSEYLCYLVTGFNILEKEIYNIFYRLCPPSIEALPNNIVYILSSLFNEAFDMILNSAKSLSEVQTSAENS